MALKFTDSSSSEEISPGVHLDKNTGQRFRSYTKEDYRAKVNDSKGRTLGLSNHSKNAASVNTMDYFTNPAARMGWGTDSLTEATQYELVRLSYDYWLMITLYTNHWIARKVVDIPASDMVRAWPRLTSEIEPKDIARIDQIIRLTATKTSILTAIKWSRLFGGAGALIVIEGQEHILDQPLDLESIELGSYKGVIPFDRWAGIQPSSSVSSDLSAPTRFNLPEYYEVQVQGGGSFKVHASRILRFSGPTVPTPEYEARQEWGVSVLEICFEEIRKRDNMSWNLLCLSYRANLISMKVPQLAEMLSGASMNQNALLQFQQRMQAINSQMNSNNMMLLPKDGEMGSVSYSPSGWADLYQQFQMDIAGAVGIPVVKLFGRTATGLAQSNDADLQLYYDKIGQEQDTDLRPQLDILYPVICMSELGEVPKDLDLIFPSARVMGDDEKAALAKSIGDLILGAASSGIITRAMALRELKQSSDVTGIFTNITDEDIAKAEEDEAAGLGGMGEEAGGAPGMPGQPQGPEADPEGGGPPKKDKGPAFPPQPQPQKEAAPKEAQKEAPKEEEDSSTLNWAVKMRERLKSMDDADFKESEHPRAGNGEFTSGGGSSKKPSSTVASSSNELVAIPRESWPAHISALRIPPAWEDVRISENPGASLLAIGKDSKGRSQYVYSQDFKDSSAAIKFSRIVELQKELPLIDTQLKACRESTDPKKKEHADCMFLIKKMGIRPGSDTDTGAEKKAYGATTLTGDHVVVEDNKVFLRFVGKKGVDLNLPVSDPAVASMLLKRKKKAKSGSLFPQVSDASLRDFTHAELDKGSFKVKDFRTSLGTSTAQKLVSTMRKPKDEQEYKRSVKAVAEHVSTLLGNTPAIALQSYIAPQVFSEWREYVAT